MAGYTVSPAAHGDLKEIFHYVAADKPDAAAGLIDLLYEKFSLLSTSPLLGELRPDLGPELRSFSIGKFALIYSGTREGIEVVPIINGARDIAALFSRE